MPLTERSRAVLYESFTRLIADEQAVQEMLSSFPAREEDELATKELVKLETALLRTDMAEMRTEMADLHTELRGEMADLRTELRGEMADLRTELGGEMAELRTELGGEMAELRVEMGELRTELRVEMAALEARVERSLNRFTWRILAVIMPMQVATFTMVAIQLTQ